MKFKVGDRVKIIKGNFRGKSGGVDEGKVATIVEYIPEENIYAVRFDSRYQWTHSCNGRCPNHDGRVYFPESLELVCNKKIVITTNGTETLARLYEGNEVIKSATAKCSPADTFVFEEGARIALHRMLGDYAESKTDKSHKYKAGDRVKVIANTCAHWCEIGETVTLSDIFEEGSTAWHIREHGGYIRECDIEPYKKTEKKPPFYNGKVVCVERGYHGSIPLSDLTVGKVYTVTDGKITYDDNTKCAGQHLTLDGICVAMGHKFIPFVE